MQPQLSTRIFCNLLLVILNPFDFGTNIGQDPHTGINGFLREIDGEVFRMKVHLGSGLHGGYFDLFVDKRRHLEKEKRKWGGTLA